VAVEEARDAATQALAAAQSSAAASPMDDAQQAPPTMLNSKGGSSGNMAHLRGQSPDAAFDLLKRTQVRRNAFLHTSIDATVSSWLIFFISSFTYATFPLFTSYRPSTRCVVPMQPPPAKLTN